MLVLLRRHPRLAATAGLLAVWGGVSAWIAATFSGNVQDWSLMNDELFYEKLATSIETTYSPVPHIHGQYVAILNQLYPLLLAPFLAAFDVPTAVHAIHVFNAPLMASACIPAYLLAREVAGRLLALGAALVTVLVPWMIMTGAVLTESVAYPAFLWAVLALQRTIAEPSRRRDVLAVAGLALAVLARTQFVFLAIVFPVALVATELASAPVRGRQRLRTAAHEAVRRHRLLAWLYAAGIVAAIGLAAAGSLASVLGRYSVTAHGSPLPASVWRAIATHLDRAAIGCGLVPLVLGGGWLLASTVRPVSRRAHAFAALGLLVTVALVVEEASFDVRFPGEGGIRDRYLFYVVPLLLAATAAALSEGRRWVTVAGAGIVAGLFAATASLVPYDTPHGYLVDAPGAIVNDFLRGEAGSFGTGSFVAFAGLLLGLVAAAGLVLVPRAPLAAAVVAFLAVFSILATRSDIDRALASIGPSGRQLSIPAGYTLDWIDKSLPPGGTAAMTPFPTTTDFFTTAAFWWDQEFWNGKLVQTLVAPDGHWSYAPFPNRTLSPDWETGVVAGSGNWPPFVAFADADPRLLLAGPRHAENLGLRLILADRPYHVAWMTRGLTTDGWLRAGKPATLRVFSTGDANQRFHVSIKLTAPPPAGARYRFTARGATRSGELAAGTARAIELDVCVPARSRADVRLVSASAAHIAGPPFQVGVTGDRHVGGLLGPIVVEPAGSAC